MMQNNRLPYAAQLPDDAFEGPTTPTPEVPQAPTPTEPSTPTSPGLPDDAFQGPGDAPLIEPGEPVVEQPVDIESPEGAMSWMRTLVSDMLINPAKGAWDTGAWGWTKSAGQNLWDMALLLRPWGERASGKDTVAPGVLDMARLFSEAGHASEMSWSKPLSSVLSLPFRGYTELDEHLFSGASQSDNETPMLDAFTGYLSGRYNFSKPEVRRAFAQVVQEDPVGVMTDLLTIPSLAFGGGAVGAKAGASVAKSAAAAAKAGSRTAKVISRVAAGMDKVLGVVDTAHRVTNAGFHIPGRVPGSKRLMQAFPERATEKGFQIKSGIADLVDPGVWGVRGVGKGIQLATRGMSRYAPKTPADKTAQREQQSALVRQGFTEGFSDKERDAVDAAFLSHHEQLRESLGLDEGVSHTEVVDALLEKHGWGKSSETNEWYPVAEDASPMGEIIDILTTEDEFSTEISDKLSRRINTPLSLVSKSDRLHGREVKALDKAFVPLEQAMNRAVSQLDTRVVEIIEQGQADGDLAQVAEALGEQYREARQALMDSVENAYAEAGIEPGLIVDMRPVYTALQNLRESTAVATRLEQSPDAPVDFAGDTSIQRLSEHVERAAAQFQNNLTANFLSGQEPAAPTRPVAADAGVRARDEAALYGVSATRLTRDLSSGMEYATTFRLMEMDDIITSHDVHGGRTPEFDEELQVKDMSESWSRAKVTDMANNLFPDQVLTGRTTQSGTPIVDGRAKVVDGRQKYQVASGNHRMNALRVARETAGTYASYLEELKGVVGKYGYSAADVEAMTAPVLVRVLDDDVDLLAFIRGANVGDVAQLSQTSQAVQDMHLLDSLADAQTSDTQTVLDVLNTSAGGDLPSLLSRRENEAFRNLFVNKLPTSERPVFVGQGSQLHPEGIRRIVDSVRARIFSGTFGASMRQLFTQARDSGFKNMQKGIDDALPALVTLRRLGEGIGKDFDISEPLAEAVMKVRHLVETAEGPTGVEKSINTYLLGDRAEGAQASLGLDVADSQSVFMRELDETGRAILELLAKGISRPSLIREFIRDYALEVERGKAPSLVDTEPLKPRAELVRELVDEKLKTAAEGKDASEVREGPGDLFGQSAGARRGQSAGARRGQNVAREAVDASRPILLENVVAYRNQLIASLESPRLGSQVREWRMAMVEALDTAIMETFQVAYPDKAAEAGRVLTFSQEVRDMLNSEFAQLISSLVGPQSNPDAPAVRRALRQVFTADDTLITIQQKYDLLGGFDSESSQVVRRVFLEGLFGHVYTDAGAADAVRRGAGTAQDAPPVTERYKPKGFQTFMNQFSLQAMDYPDDHLRAILGDSIVDDLYDLDMILQQFGEFMQRVKKDTPFFDGEGRSRRYAMERISEGIGWGIVSGVASAAGAAGFGWRGAVTSTLAAVSGFLLQAFGQRAASAAYPILFRFEGGRNALINGIEVAMKESWNTGHRVLLRQGRLVNKTEEDSE